MDRPLRRFHRDEEEVSKTRETDSIARIAQAKRTAERAGYEVELARPKINRPFMRPAGEGRTTLVQDAIKTAQDAGYKVSRQSELQQAAQTARDAGYEVKRMTRLQQAAQTARDAGYRIKKEEQAPSQEPEISHEERQENNYVARAAHFLTRDEE